MPVDSFVELVRQAGVTVIADVRTAPFSRRSPHFNRDALRSTLKGHRIGYVFMGEALGGRPREQRLLSGGTADYESMAAEPMFRAGLERVVKGAARHRIALMCAEQDPLGCHRCLLVGRALARRLVRVEHILRSGQILGQDSIEDALLAAQAGGMADFFSSREEQLDLAYRARKKNVAFKERRSEAERDEAAA